ncbi:hypothetical protein A3G50_01085 [Candidatus Jorgensenbacteria bacterium RIFCSPLOWO2_12_FULL_42_11]|uniref:TrbC/VirB2 family protein n=1 Tax=Candidatus Jorgensenbacteria bacterium RIFCSPLOWO2_12_FULL_42_11 TaxID=1798473 RepID=A0A1F6C201_9BACT|nr:MAG: hypothetical protein A3G50_01085 [Candidatus Jorgensenbacteria bacterium RIFCSPLOWO2_12_FULL_42_11]
MKNKRLNTILLISLIGLPILALAQTGVQTPPTPITSIEGVFRVINTLTNWIFTILLIIAVFFIMMAAFAYLGSAGEATKVAEAQNKLIYAAVAIGVGLIAKGVEFVVRQLLGA